MALCSCSVPKVAIPVGKIPYLQIKQLDGELELSGHISWVQEFYCTSAQHCPPPPQNSTCWKPVLLGKNISQFIMQMLGKRAQEWYCTFIIYIVYTVQYFEYSYIAYLYLLMYNVYTVE